MIQFEGSEDNAEEEVFLGGVLSSVILKKSIKVGYPI
jgi:hypothetical protein